MEYVHRTNIQDIADWYGGGMSIKLRKYLIEDSSTTFPPTAVLFAGGFWAGL